MASESYVFDEASVAKIARTVRSELARDRRTRPQRRRKNPILPVQSLTFTNLSGETMPAHGVGVITGIDADSILQVDKPTATVCDALDRVEYVVNLGDDVPNSEVGTCVYMRDITPEHPVQVLYDNRHQAPSFGEIWGPWFDGWSISRGAAGMVILSSPDTDNSLVTCKAQEDGDAEFTSRYVISGTGTGAPSTVPPHSALFCYTARGGTFISIPTLYAHNGKDSSTVEYLRSRNYLTVFTGPYTVGSATLAAYNGLFQGEYGRAKPCLATYAGSTPSNIGELYGPISGQQLLFKGIPGFEFVGVPQGSTTDEMFVVWAPHKFGWCKATSDWVRSGEVATMTVRAVTDSTGATVYDGSSADLPLVEFDVSMLCYGGDPLLRVDDVFQYRIDGNAALSSNSYAVPVGEYLGARLGTVQLWTVSGTSAPRGWAIMNGTDNSGANGGSGFDMRGRFPVGYNSAETPYDTIGEAGTFGTTGTNYKYRALAFIERIR